MEDIRESGLTLAETVSKHTHSTARCSTSCVYEIHEQPQLEDYTIFGKVGKVANEDVVLQLLSSKCFNQ